MMEYSQYELYFDQQSANMQSMSTFSHTHLLVVFDRCYIVLG
jgi:hypothetical protein